MEVGQMITYGKIKNVAINCRCGKRNIWHMPADVKDSIDSRTPMIFLRAGEGHHSIVPIEVALFSCECGRIFEYSCDGLKNVSDNVDCKDMVAFMKQTSASRMVN